MEPAFFIGIDISKLTLDVAVLRESTLLETRKIENSEAAVREILVALKSAHGCTPENTIYCAEHMGIYGKFLQDVLVKKNARLCLESPLQIKLSLGIQRGKSDTLDAIRIAQYAQKNANLLKFWAPPRPSIEKLKTLMTIRKKLSRMSTMLKNSKKMESYFLSEPSRKDINSYTRSTFEAIRVDIDNIEREMVAIIDLDGHLHNLMQIISSVPHIGRIIATEVIVLTNEFRDITCPKKFSSYCGIAPFARTSGTSLKGKPRISSLANKDMKTNLHLAALGSTRPGKSKFKAYYARKVLEGKNKMSILNAIRNKLVHVIFACVRENKLYEEQPDP
jgi:transposase